MNDDLPRAPEWMPESELRDVLFRGKLPAALRNKNLFWINIQRYLKHSDADLPPDDYLRHWNEVYERCLSEDLSTLRGLTYVSFEEPTSERDVH
jgi:hypothetical protein